MNLRMACGLDKSSRRRRAPQIQMPTKHREAPVSTQAWPTAHLRKALRTKSALPWQLEPGWMSDNCVTDDVLKLRVILSISNFEASVLELVRCSINNLVDCSTSATISKDQTVVHMQIKSKLLRRNGRPRTARSQFIQELDPCASVTLGEVNQAEILLAAMMPRRQPVGPEASRWNRTRVSTILSAIH